jgi:hypothetical protein
MLQITPLGLQVFNLCKVDAEMEYLRAVAAHMKEQGFDVTVAQCVDIDARRFQYSDPRPI